MNTFLTSDEVATLTGRKLKSKQIEALRKMALPFFVNASGRPVVTAAAVHGTKAEPEKKQWELPRLKRKYGT